jgi:nicotinate-nucleotide adenylyltransferase
MKPAIKYGIWGGLFDPPHAGHVILAQWIKTEFGLNKIIFMPAGRPPHKTSYSPYRVRHHMARLAVKGNPAFQVTDIERHIAGTTYTVDVIRRLKKGLRGKPYVIIGADQWNEILTWKEPDRLFEECRFIVVPRMPYKIREFKPCCGRALISRCPAIGISSTLIRERTRKGLPIRYLVPDAVHDYIKKKKLYLT